MDTQKYLSLFLQEVRDNSVALSAGLVDLEKDMHNIDALQELMRLAHGCKGACATMEFTHTAELVHILEDVFDAARTEKITMTSDAIDICLEAMDAFDSSLEHIESDGKEVENFEMISELQAIAAGKVVQAKQKIQSKKSTTQEQEAPSEISHIRVDAKKLDQMMDIAGEFTLLKLQLVELCKDPSAHALLGPYIDNITRLTDELAYQASDCRLVPLEQAFARFSRLVRDLGKEQGKDITFTMEGVDIDLDKTLVDHIATPLIHLLRNAVDHGIEQKGDITLRVQRDQGFAKFSVLDNGVPITWDVIEPIAKKRGLDLSLFPTKDENALLQILCDPRFSSSESVTDVSGRGVGMSAVDQTAKSLGGVLSLTQEEGIKTFTLALPLQLSIIRALLVNSAEVTYALPFIHVQRLLTIKQSDIKTTLGIKAMVIDGVDVPLLSLHEAFHDTVCPLQRDMELPLVLIEYESGTVGIIVDELLGNEEIMVKPISSAIRNKEFCTGSTILADGRVGLILDIPSIIRLSASDLQTSV